MGRNESCFCGSGLKYKKCHNDIHEFSKAARLIKTYNIIDMKIKEHYEKTENILPCRPGCASCCSDYFTITDIEYDMIMYAIKDWSSNEKETVISKAVKNTEKFKKDFPEIFDYFEENSTNDRDISKVIKNIPDDMKMPCVFLDESTKNCKIYKVRPLICRLFGASFSFDISDNIVCDIIGTEKAARIWQADLREINEDQYKFDLIKLNEVKTIMIKRYPIFYLIYYNHKMNKDFQIIHFNENFKQSEQQITNMIRNYMKI